LWNRKDIEKKPYGNIFLNMFMVSLIIYYYAYELIEIANRFRLSYLISVIVLFPYLIEGYLKYINKVFISIIIVLYCFTFNRGIYYDKSASQYISFNPYQNYLIYKTFDLKSTGSERLKKGNEMFERQRKEMTTKE